MILSLGVDIVAYSCHRAMGNWHHEGIGQQAPDTRAWGPSHVHLSRFRRVRPEEGSTRTSVAVLMWPRKFEKSIWSDSYLAIQVACFHHPPASPSHHPRAHANKIGCPRSIWRTWLERRSCSPSRRACRNQAPYEFLSFADNSNEDQQL